MDREYKEILYSSMFDELDRLQANKLHNDPELQKVALNLKPIVGGVRRGARSLVSNPSGFMSNVSKTWKGTKAAPGMAGWGKRIGAVLGTDEGKLLAAGAGGLGVAGTLLASRRQPQQQVIVQR